jgi:hypothetical protein
MEKLIYKKDGTVERLTLTAEEEAARNAEIATIKAEDDERTAAREAVAEQKATLKASAKAKLIAGEALTEAEADTVVI